MNSHMNHREQKEEAEIWHKYSLVGEDYRLKK